MKKSVFTSYDELPLLLNVKQLAELLGVSDSSVYELIQEDDFPSLRIGKRIVIPKEELRNSSKNMRRAENLMLVKRCPSTVGDGHGSMIYPRQRRTCYAIIKD